MTGHASIESLEPYIHIAFADTIGFTETVDRTIQNKDLHSFHGILLQIANEIDHGLSKDETKAIIMQLADSIESL